MREWWHTLTPGLVNILFTAIRHVKTTGVNKFHYLNDLKLNHSGAANLQKLRFFGLIAHYDEENHRSGNWLITLNGGRFLRGEIDMPRRVRTYRNRVVGHDEQRITVNDFRGKLSWYEQEFDFEIHAGQVTPKQELQPALTKLGSNEPWKP